MYTWGMFDWQAGEDSFKKAIDLKPAYPEAHIYYSHLLNILARPEEARVHAELALKLDPANPLVIALYAVDLIFFHEYEKASKLGFEVLQMDPTSGLAAFAIAFANYQLGDFLKSTEGMIKIFSIQYPGVVEGIELSFTEENYKKTVEIITEKAIKRRNETYVGPVDIAQNFYMLNKKDQVVEWCEKGFEEHDPNMPYIAQLFEGMGDDPRFQQIVRKMNLPIK
jgi:tetratricopeptide (TPR) repeat protein